MTRGTESLRAGLMALAAGMAIAALPAVARAGDVVVVTTTIQAAVDAANPGDTVVVPPGEYTECVVVDKDNLTIQGSHGAVLDAEGCENGITVGTGSITTPGPGPFPQSQAAFAVVSLAVPPALAAAMPATPAIAAARRRATSSFACFMLGFHLGTCTPEGTLARFPRCFPNLS